MNVHCRNCRCANLERYDMLNPTLATSCYHLPAPRLCIIRSCPAPVSSPVANTQIIQTGIDDLAIRLFEPNNNALIRTKSTSEEAETPARDAHARMHTCGHRCSLRCADLKRDDQLNSTPKPM